MSTNSFKINLLPSYIRPTIPRKQTKRGVRKYDEIKYTITKLIIYVWYYNINANSSQSESAELRNGYERFSN